MVPMSSFGCGMPGLVMQGEQIELHNKKQPKKSPGKDIQKFFFPVFWKYFLQNLVIIIRFGFLCSKLVIVIFVF